MRSWPVVVEPVACPGWQVVAAGWHLAAATVPWLAGCAPPVAAALTLLAVAGLPATLGAIPGRHAAIRALRLEQDVLQLTLRDGSVVVAHLLPSSQAWRDGALLRLDWAGGTGSWWLPRAAVEPQAFRRLKARVRLGP